ncbi:MAG: HDOD domain-containing protein [Desulfobacula sp.]|nr:HDOD domain-containing protein [Desulfobacula sp.]
MKNNLMGEKTISDGMSLEILISRVKLPPLPTNGAKLLDMAQQPMDEIDISSFAKLVEMDPGLFASVLQLANSPYYSGVDGIISMRAAITRIGLTETINSICLYFFQKMLPKLPAIEGFSSREYWAYSWACAMANRRLGHPNLGMGVLPGELYIAGLLHGMGKLLIAIHYPNEFSKCVIKARDFKQPLYKIEQDVFGTTDAFVASKIMEAWNLPANICTGVAFHQMPESAPDEYKEIAGLTQFAYCIAAMSGIGKSGDGLLMDLSSTYIYQQSNLQISREETREKIIREIIESLEKKSESVTGLSSKSSTRTPDKEDIGKEKSPAKKRALPKTKKGFFARIRSLLGAS